MGGNMPAPKPDKKAVTWEAGVIDNENEHIRKKKDPLRHAPAFKAYADGRFDRLFAIGLSDTVLGTLQLMSRKRKLGHFLKYDEFKTVFFAINHNRPEIIRYVLEELTDGDFNKLCTHDNYSFIKKLMVSPDTFYNDITKALGPQVHGKLAALATEYKQAIMNDLQGNSQCTEETLSKVLIRFDSLQELHAKPSMRI
ncbi:MAG: hypothetical protein VXW60_02770 [Bacteroidota bacterium]|nr:hypothetical protein [Bacteroidota bacterium]